MMTVLRHPLFLMITLMLTTVGGLYLLTDFNNVAWVDPSLIIVIAAASTAAALSLLLQTDEWTTVSAGLLGYFTGNAVLWTYALFGPRDARGSLTPDAVELIPAIALLVIGALFFVSGMIRGRWDSFRVKAEAEQKEREDLKRISDQLAAVKEAAENAVREAAAEALAHSDERQRVLLSDAAKQATLLEVRDLVAHINAEPDEYDHEDDGSLT